MILAVDVAYHGTTATVAGVLFRDWTDVRPAEEVTVSCPVTEAYVPGDFYRRELPCIAALLQELSEPPACIVIDGFVFLGREKKPGLGKHLHDMLEGKVAVIGVAKTPFAGSPPSCELRRGKSEKPLYVTAVGIPGSSAKTRIGRMHGRGRIPTLLRRADRLSRSQGAGQRAAEKK